MFSPKIELKTVKDMFKKIYSLLMVGALIACTAAAPRPMVKVPGSNDISPNQKQSVVVHLVAEMLAEVNYKKLPLDDSLSTVIYTRYLKSLDENHNYLMASDVQVLISLKPNWMMILRPAT
jgi:carboxyl-terminal processing protease